MDKRKLKSGIIFVGPGRHSQGGISAVIENYHKTSFWQEFDCSHFESTADQHSVIKLMISDSWKLVLFTWRLLVSPKPRAISIHASHKGSFYRKLTYLIIAKLFRIPAVVHIHPAAFADYYSKGNRLRRAAIRFAGRLSDQIICLSDETRSDLSQVFPASKLAVLGNPVDIQYYSQNRKSEYAQRPRILYLGWIVQQKGVYDMVDAIPEVASQFPEVLFTFAGNKEVEELRKLISSRGLDKFAEVLGWIDGQSKLDLLSSSRILALPSYTEGVPNVILEAMASKLPIVTTPVGGIPSVLTHEKTAIFVEPGNVSSIAEALIALLGDERKCIRLASAAFERASEFHSIEAISDGLTQTYDRYRLDTTHP